ncbi:MAG: pepsin-like aspartic protease [Acidobacteriaceae bacterium]
MPATERAATRRPIRIPITNVHLGGDYTGVVTVGAQQKAANVILDTGSSTLALDGNFYNPSEDKSSRLTNVAQEIQYGGGSWIGAVVQSDVRIGGERAPRVNLAIAYVVSENIFGKGNGILGLAYTRLNKAFTLPGKTWPPRYHYNQIQDGLVTFLPPYFTQMEKEGILANKFAFYTKRSLTSYAKNDPSADPLNKGFLVLGGGEESEDLYDRSQPFRSVRVMADDWYNTNLKSIIVGASDPIRVPPPTKGTANLTNSIIDSGTNRLILNQALFDTLTERLSKGSDRQFVHAMRSGYLPMNQLDRKTWPNITFVLEGVSGNVSLAVTPQNYWQVNSPERGYATASISGDGGQLDGLSILGLPLMNGYFTIFDRSIDRLGVIKFAPQPST